MIDLSSLTLLMRECQGPLMMVELRLGIRKIRRDLCRILFPPEVMWWGQSLGLVLWLVFRLGEKVCQGHLRGQQARRFVFRP